MTQQERYEYKKKWAEDNAEKVRESKRKYYENNKQKVVEAARKWAEENYEANKVRNKDRATVRRRKKGVAPVGQEYNCRSEGHPFTEENTYYTKTGRKCRECVNTKNKHRTHQKRTGGTFPKENWKMLLEAFGTWCPYCETDGHNLTIDHITPISKGGDNSIENLMPCCLSCNISKNATPIHIWKPELGHLSLPGDYERE